MTKKRKRVFVNESPACHHDGEKWVWSRDVKKGETVRIPIEAFKHVNDKGKPCS